jgi:xanthine/CO dehydrogenase XdhC/CoxF family maturation factor
MSVELGWRITIQDHRPAYIEKGNFSAAASVYCVPVKSLSKEINLEEFDAAIVMSHHIEVDRDYLRILAGTNIPYIGLLGPKERKNKILDELGEVASSLKDRLHGPAGLDIGGRGPSTIALSIVSQIHQELIYRKVL